MLAVESSVSQSTLAASGQQGQAAGHAATLAQVPNCARQACGEGGLCEGVFLYQETHGLSIADVGLHARIPMHGSRYKSHARWSTRGLLRGLEIITLLVIYVSSLITTTLPLDALLRSGT